MNARDRECRRRVRVSICAGLALGLLATTRASAESSATPPESVRSAPVRDMTPVAPRTAPDSGAPANASRAPYAPGSVRFGPGPAGASQYVQWNGTALAVFDTATGALLCGPVAGITLFHALGGPCATHTEGQPTAVYDRSAGRWVLSLLIAGAAPGDSLRCVAVSTTADATGAYELHEEVVEPTRTSQGSDAAREPLVSRATPAVAAQCTPANCDDNNPCTVDVCDPVLGCVFTATNCDDGNACTADTCSPVSAPGVATIFVGHDFSQLERQYQKIGTFTQTWGAIGQATGAAVDANGIVYICNPAFGPNVIEKRGPGNTNLGTITSNLGGAWIEDLGNYGGGYILASTSAGDIVKIDTTTGAGTLMFSTGHGLNGVTFDGTNIWTTGGNTTALVYKRNLAGTVLASFSTGQMNGGIGYDPDDGTLWIGHPNGQITHHTQSGNLLGGFSTAAGGGYVDGVELANLALPAGCQHNALDCNDSDPCTDDACDPLTGCVHPPHDCDDSNPCTDDTCDPATGCVHTNNTAPCEDSDLCTSGDTCSDGFCIPGPPVNCDDSNPCTTDSCDPRFGCAHTSLPPGSACDDGNACTIENACVNGICQPGVPADCDDHNACTTDTCVPASGCAHTSLPPGSACDDGNACTTGDTCIGGICQAVPVVCAAPDACHLAGTCDPLFGGCTNPPAPDGTPCNDGDPCTAGDACVGGACAGGSVIALPAETQNLAISADRSTVSWTPDPEATTYDVVRGDAASFPVGSSGAAEVCFDDLPIAKLVDAASPAPGSGYWYLARAKNPCGHGPWGVQSNGVARDTRTCP